MEWFASPATTIENETLSGPFHVLSKAISMPEATFDEAVNSLKEGLKRLCEDIESVEETPSDLLNLTA